MNATLVNDLELFEAGGPGTVMIIYGVFDPFGVLDDTQPAQLAIKCPGCGEQSALPLDGSTDPASPGWALTHVKGRITLTPSVHHDVPGCGWHGHLRDGEWTP